MRARGAFLPSVLSAAALLSACARCPEPRSVRELPTSVRDRLALDRDGVGTFVYDHAPPNGPVRIEIVDIATLDADVAWPPSAAAGVRVPMHRSRTIWGVEGAIVSVEGQRRDIPTLRIDTGLFGTLSMSRAAAEDAGVFLVSEVRPGQSHTAFGPKTARLGVFGALELGPVRLTPAGAQVECDGPAFLTNVGIDVLDFFGHVIFDWQSQSMILLPKGSADRTGAIRDLPGWSTAPWDRGPVVSRRDSLRSRGAGTRRYTVVKRDRLTSVEIDGQRYSAVIDTGFSADVFSFEPLGLSGERDRWKGTGFGRTATFDVVRADTPVRFAGIEFDNPSVLEPQQELADYAQRAGADVIIGLGVLERFPMWLDFERDEVRFWTSDEPLPRFVD